MIPAVALKRRLLALLSSRKGEFAPANPELDKFDHSLQCATRAWKAGEPPDYVVMALFHDVFGGFSAVDHGRMAAMVLGPYLTKRSWNACCFHVHEMAFVRKYGVAAAMLASGPHLAFARDYDYPSFDPNYESYELARFYPLIDEVIHD